MLISLWLDGNYSGIGGYLASVKLWHGSGGTSSPLIAGKIHATTLRFFYSNTNSLKYFVSARRIYSDLLFNFS